jgi:hypothetical protein
LGKQMGKSWENSGSSWVINDFPIDFPICWTVFFGDFLMMMWWFSRSMLNCWRVFWGFFWRNTCGNLLELANIYPSKKTWKAWAIGFSSNFSFEASSGWHVRKWLYTPSQLLF